MKIAESILVTSVAGTRSVATYVAGAYLSAVYHVSTYPKRRALVRRVHAHWDIVRPVTRCVFPWIRTTAPRIIDPRIIRAPARRELDTFASGFFAMIFSSAQRRVAASIISSPVLYLKPVNPPSMGVAAKIMPMPSHCHADMRSFKNGIAKSATHKKSVLWMSPAFIAVVWVSPIKKRRNGTDPPIMPIAISRIVSRRESLGISRHERNTIRRPKIKSATTAFLSVVNTTGSCTAVTAIFVRKLFVPERKAEATTSRVAYIIGF